MIKLKNSLVILLLTVIMITINILPAAAKSGENQSAKTYITTETTQQGYTLKWEKSKNEKVLKKAIIGEVEYDYTYNDNKNRISKASRNGTVTFTYNNESMLLSEKRGENEFTYQYDTLNSLVGFTINGIAYTYVKDDSFNIVAINDENSNEVAKYEYDTNGIVSAILGKDNNGIWVDMSGDSSFIGTLNLIRLHSYYYDNETGWYYIGYKYYDSTKNKFVGGADNLNLISTYEDFSKNTVSIAVSQEIAQRIATWQTSLLNTSSFGAPIKTFTSSWYSNLSDVEILSRLIYGENTTNTADQNAVAWVIINRYNNGSFGGKSYRGIATYSGAFEPITGGSNGTANARVPNLSSTNWKHAVYIACTLLTTYNNSDYSDIITKPTGMSSQLFFVGLNYYLLDSNCRNANPGLLYNMDGRFVGIKDVVIVFDTSTSYKNPSCIDDIKNYDGLKSFNQRQSHNIFFNLK